MENFKLFLVFKFKKEHEFLAQRWQAPVTQVINLLNSMDIFSMFYVLLVCKKLYVK